MFDREFFEHLLPIRAATVAAAHPEQVPVVRIHLGDGTVLDTCRVATPSDAWLEVAYFREAPTCDDVDYTFVRYAAIARVTISQPHRRERALGFGVPVAPGSADRLAGDVA